MSDSTTARRGAGLVLEVAGLIGLIATLALFALVFSGWVNTVFWQTASVAVVGNTLYIIYQLALWLTGINRRHWRELVIAVMVPAIALVLVLLLSASNAGLVSLLGQTHRTSATQPATTLDIDPNGHITKIDKASRVDD